MIAALLPALLMGALSLDLDVSAVYGYSGRHAVGLNGEIAAGFPVWNTSAADGWLRGGALVGYQAEPYAQDNAVLEGSKASGAGHRLQAWIFVEHRFRLLPTRRLHLGVSVFGGWTELFVRGAVDNDTTNVHGKFSYEQGAFAMGLAVTIGYQLTERVTLVAKGFAPFPIAPGALTGYVLATLGLSFTVAAF